MASDLHRRAPALWRSQNDHRPTRTARHADLAAFTLRFSDLPNTVLDRRRHRLVHALGIGSLYKVGRPAVALEKVLQLFVSDPGQKSGVVDFISVQVEDRENSAVANGVEELADMPRGRQRAGLGLAITNDGRDDQIRIIESGSACVRSTYPNSPPS